MKQKITACWVLYKSFFDAVPGQKVALSLGILLWLLAYIEQDEIRNSLFTLSGTFFMVAFTLVFAGPHFRKLASFKKHKLLPQFKGLLITSYLAVLLSLTTFTAVGVLLLQKHSFASLNSIPTDFIIPSVASVIFLVSLVGFLSRYYRLVFLALVLMSIAKKDWIAQQPITHLLLAIHCIAVLGLIYFFYAMRKNYTQQFYTKQPVSIAKYTPGLNGRFDQAGVTPAGSILLGLSDGYKSRFTRAFFTAFLLPVGLLTTIAIFTNGLPSDLFTTKPVLLFGLATAMGLHLHLIFTAISRRRSLWLRVGGGKKQINRVIQSVLAKERWTMAFCFLLWCLPLLTLYPQTLLWVLGGSLLIWFMLLFIEQLLLSLKQPLSQSAEFFLMLFCLGLLAALYLLSVMTQQPLILWWGMAVLLAGYGILNVKRRITP